MEANRLSSAATHRNFYFRSRIKFTYHVSNLHITYQIYISR